MIKAVIFSIVFFTLTGYLFSQDLDEKIKTIDLTMIEIDSQIKRLESKKDSLINERKKVLREKALNQLGNKYFLAKINSDKTPLKESMDGFNMILRLNKNDEVEILGANDNYLFVRKDDFYGFVSPMFISKDDSEVNDFINGLIEDDRIQREVEKLERIASQEKNAKEQLAKAKQQNAIREQKRLQEIKSKFSPETAQRIIDKQIWIGMTREMATASKGFPKQINRTVMSNLVKEQWVYENSFYLYFDNDILTAWQD